MNVSPPPSPLGFSLPDGAQSEPTSRDVVCLQCGQQLDARMACPHCAGETERDALAEARMRTQQLKSVPSAEPSVVETPSGNPYRSPAAQVAKRPESIELDLKVDPPRVARDREEQVAYDPRAYMAASPSSRIAAQLLNTLFDALTLIPAGFVFFLALPRTPPPEREALEAVARAMLPAAVILIFAQFVLAALHLISLVKYRASLGKYVLGLQVADYKTGKPASMGQLLGLRIFAWALIASVPAALVRLLWRDELGQLIGMLIGANLAMMNIAMLFTFERRCLYDLLAGTIVIVRREPQFVRHGSFVPVEARAPEIATRTFEIVCLACGQSLHVGSPRRYINARCPQCGERLSRHSDQEPQLDAT